MGDEAAQRKGWAVPERCRSSILSWAIICGGIVMNTAMARRLALGDRVIWMGKDDCQPSGPGTITRITAHQVDVLWEGEIARRYRRAQLHNLRQVSRNYIHRSMARRTRIEYSATHIMSEAQPRLSSTACSLMVNSPWRSTAMGPPPSHCQPATKRMDRSLGQT